MANNNFLDNTLLAQLWTKMLNTFELRGALLENATTIWSNPNPHATSFASQTISNLPDLSGFKYFIVEWKQSYVDAGSLFEWSTNEYYQEQYGGTPTITRLNFNFNGGYEVRYLNRVANSNTSLLFTQTYKYYNGNTTLYSGNEDCIPLKIYGCNRITGMTVSILEAYPVNSLYFSAVHVSPASFMGGTWTELTSTSLTATIPYGTTVPVYADGLVHDVIWQQNLKFKNVADGTTYSGKNTLCLDGSGLARTGTTSATVNSYPAPSNLWAELNSSDESTGNNRSITGIYIWKRTA